MNRGYAGFYKGYYLRSSYEYAYARYLDYQKISWKYEVRSFDIGYKIYKPDFFLYDQNGLLIEIVEIKSRNKEAKETANTSLSPLLKEIYERFDVKDFRVISKAVFGEDRGRKELLKFMKKVCNEKVC
ncbi:PDDEXK family nuclease [Gracilibacillus thailandensis]|uniref:DUF1064 domain-containing protein n=2 Tax=Gracilibacillus thailandensis TaxID=563735 RepID=A0A6N7QYK9_9BACI|nr:hypothetical protein [Gracilibacillus thailandensis]MRI64989.1 hypothetical protein [Gracilibacillus thailandensis]